MNAKYCIRPLKEKDLESAMVLVWAVFSEFEAPKYCNEGIREFQDYIQLHAIKKRLQSGELTIWGCFDGQDVVGVLAVRPPCHISLLFVHKRYHRQGIARALFGRLLSEYPVPDGCAAITVHSSPYAAEAYRHLGFHDTDAEQTVNGLRFIPMRRLL